MCFLMVCLQGIVVLLSCVHVAVVVFTAALSLSPPFK